MGSPYKKSWIGKNAGLTLNMEGDHQKGKRTHCIVMIANTLPQCVTKPGPFQARFMRMRFFSRIKKLDEARIIATLSGCMKRRIELIQEEKKKKKKRLKSDMKVHTQFSHGGLDRKRSQTSCTGPQRHRLVSQSKLHGKGGKRGDTGRNLQNSHEPDRQNNSCSPKSRVPHYKE
jgi:hypothetical protein